jgi:hypothetical protein
MVRTERGGRDDGAGVLSSLFGVTVFLSFLLFAVQLLLTLHATSVVTSVVYDAARSVAVRGAESGSDAVRADAAQHARTQLGRYGRDATFQWLDGEPGRVTLHVRVATPRLLGIGLDRLIGIDAVDRTVTVRVEDEQ